MQSFDRAWRLLTEWTDSIDPVVIVTALAIVAVVYVLRHWLARLAIAAASAILKRLNARIDDASRKRVQSAVEVLIVAIACYFALYLIDPPALAGGILNSIIISVCVLAVFSSWYQLAAPFVSMLRNERLGDMHVETDWIVRVTQFAIVLFAITALLEVWQIDISGALTGVGVFGAGLAIAAQDLVRNLIAGMTNLSEERFETGDAIEVDGEFVGTVARIDLRSTLIVGFDQVPRYVPNSELSNAVVKNYSRMRHRRVTMSVPLVLSSTAEQIEAVRDGLRDYLENCGIYRLDEGASKYVYANHMSDHAVEIMFYALTVSSSYEGYLRACEALNLTVLRLVEEAGTKLAYPTQTIGQVPDPTAE